MNTPKVFEKAWFEVWRDPLAFYEAARTTHGAIGLPDLFLKRQWNYALEAWAAGEFATLVAKHNQAMVRLGHLETEPDFYLLANGSILPFEVTELLEADRRRGDEYRAANGDIILIDPDETYHEFLRQIEGALNRKFNRRYDPPRNLLLYNNISIFENLREKLYDMHTITKKFNVGFESIWVMHNKYAVRMWPPTKNGNLRSLS